MESKINFYHVVSRLHRHRSGGGMATNKDELSIIPSGFSALAITDVQKKIIGSRINIFIEE